MSNSLAKSQKQTLKNIEEKPKKRLGQNFLISQQAITKMVEAADISKGDIILEIGPGLGALTFELAKSAKKVIAIEKDRAITQKLIEDIKERGIDNIEAINGDILNFQFSIFNFQTYKVVANIPYYLTNPLIMKFLETQNSPKVMVLMVQKEVAKRIVAKPPKTNKLAIFCQVLSEAKIVSYIKKESFWPRPKVDSAIIKMIPIDKYKKELNMPLFSKIVNAGFSHPRKQLLNNFSENMGVEKEKILQWLKQNNIEPAKRAEALSLENWINLTNSFALFVHIS